MSRTSDSLRRPTWPISIWIDTGPRHLRYRRPACPRLVGRHTGALGYTAGRDRRTRHKVRVTLDGIVLPPRPAPELKADVIDPTGEASGSSGRPVPHFYPAPALPGRIKAINYDKGGEGVAFHTTRRLPERTNYRPDDFSIAGGGDVGGDFVLGGLCASEWMRYTVDCGRGGWFDLTARVASAPGGGRLRVVALDQVVAVIDVPATGGDDTWKDITIPGVYLNPGEISLLAYVDQPGFRFNSLGFERTAHPPAIYPAVRAARVGMAEIQNGSGSAGRGAVRNLCHLGTSLTWGVVAPHEGAATLRFLYQNSSDKALPYEVAIDGAPGRPLNLLPTGGEWKTTDLNVTLESGANRVEFRSLIKGWESVALEELQLVQP